MRALTSSGRVAVGALAVAAAVGLAGLPAAMAADAVNVDLANAASAASANPNLLTYASGLLTVTGGPVTLKGTAPAGTTVDIAANAEVTLDGATIAATDTAAALKVDTGKSATIIVAGASTLTGSAKEPGLGVPQGATAALSGTALLTATASGQAPAVGGDGNAASIGSADPTGVDNASCGTLDVQKGAQLDATATGYGAAIGGGAYGAGCTVQIAANAVVTATAASGAGIGGGAGLDGLITGYNQWSPGGNGGQVTINGGTVTATSSESAAIGGGRTGENTGAGDDQRNTPGASGSLAIKGGSVKLKDGDPSSVKGAHAGNAATPDGVVAVRPIAAPGVKSVTVDGADWGISANHPSDTSLHLYVTNANHTVVVTTADGPVTYDVQSSTRPPLPVTAATPSSSPSTTPASPSASPTTKPATPTTKPATPTTKPATPTTKPATPTTKPATPTTKPATPTTKPATPTTKPTTPTTKPTTPAGGQTVTANPTALPQPGATITETIPVPPMITVTVTSAPKTVPVSVKKLASHRPAIKGTAKAGHTVKAKTYQSKWTQGSKLTVKWYVKAKKVSSASKLKLRRGYKGKRVLVKVTGSKAGYQSVTRASASKKIK